MAKQEKNGDICNLKPKEIKDKTWFGDFKAPKVASTQPCHNSFFPIKKHVTLTDDLLIYHGWVIKGHQLNVHILQLDS